MSIYKLLSPLCIYKDNFGNTQRDTDIELMLKALDVILDKRPKAQAFANIQCNKILSTAEYIAEAGEYSVDAEITREALNNIKAITGLR